MVPVLAAAAGRIRKSEPAAAAVCGLWFPEADTSPDADVFQPQGRAR